MIFENMRLDHVGIRVSNLAVAEAFYRRLGFVRDPQEYSETASACGLLHLTGLRMHLIFNGIAAPEGNVLLDATVKRPGYTHAAFVMDRMDELGRWLAGEAIDITEGPVPMGNGRRRVCFIRDPDRIVLEFNELLG